MLLATFAALVLTQDTQSSSRCQVEEATIVQIHGTFKAGQLTMQTKVAAQVAS